MTQPIPANVGTVYQDIKQLIEAAKGQVVSQVNQTLVLTYWQIGKRIKTEALQDERAQYGSGIIKQLAAQLTREYGNGFSHSSLTRMAKFYAYLPEQAIVATLSQQTSFPRLSAHRYTQVSRIPSFRQGFATRFNESRQAVLPDALRVKANLFQTDLCRNPGYMDVFELTILGAGYPLPGGDNEFLSIVYNDELGNDMN